MMHNHEAEAAAAEVEIHCGIIQDVYGSFGSGLIQIRVLEIGVESTPAGGWHITTHSVLLPADNGPTIRALDMAFGDVITEGHTFDAEAVRGRAIFYSWDEMGICMAGFTPMGETADVEGSLWDAWVHDTLGLPRREDIVQEGVARAEGLLAWAAVPRVGNTVDEVDVEVRGRIENADEAEAVFRQRFWAAEENDRSFSPFEFTACKLNDLEGLRLPADAYGHEEPVIQWEVWEAFEEGLAAALDAEVARITQEGGWGNDDTNAAE
jgi:hypothetical protein